MNTETQTTTIEVNGVKLEVDLRNAKRIDVLKVGTRVKVLKKEYGDRFNVMHGVIIGFEPFKELPTIIVAATKMEYGEAKIDFIYYNSKTSDVEIVVSNDSDEASLDKADFLEHINKEIKKKESEIQELKHREQFFIDKFACYWTAIDTTETNA
tara:strand:- start:4 stop:465 length:462 start_codon:yes stop_codon:yes gene_type:complete